MYLFRAINENEINNLELYNSYMCNLILHKNDDKNSLKRANNVIYEIINNDFSLALDRIIGHINGKGLKFSPWISTSKCFNLVTREYTIPQSGNFNIDDYRKEVIVIDTQDEINLACARDDKNINSYIGKYIDLSEHKLKNYNLNNLILPYCQNEKAYYCSTSSLFKSMEIDEKGNVSYKKHIEGFDNFAYWAKEVLIYYSINQNKVKYTLNPLMQDIIYCYTYNKAEEETNKLIDILYNKFQNLNFESLLSIEELNIYNYLYKPVNGKYNSLVNLIKYTYLSNKDINTTYEVLKEIKRNILRKITKLEDIAIVDDDIFVLNNIKSTEGFSNSKKNDIVYCLDENNNLLEKKEVFKLFKK